METTMEEAKAYFDQNLAYNLELIGMPGVNVNFALKHVYYPLLVRWIKGERSEEFKNELLSVG